jgi:predicted type IV restriction endonuclease
MGTCPDSIKRLIDRFEHQSDQLRSPDYNETLIRIDYINPLMTELGWDIDNRQGFAEQYREVVHEDRVRVPGKRE